MPGGDGCECLELGCVDDGAASNGVVTRFASPAACEALGLAAGSEASGSSSNRQKRNLMLVCAYLSSEPTCTCDVVSGAQPRLSISHKDHANAVDSCAVEHSDYSCVRIELG